MSENGQGTERTPVGPGWLMGRPFGIPVYVTPTWLIAAAIITVVFAPGIGEDLPDLGQGRFAVAFAYAVLLYLSVLVHEFGHALTARRLGLQVRRITLQLLGGVTEMEGRAGNPGREFKVALAGPVLSLTLAGLGLLAYRSVSGESLSMQVVHLLLGALSWANFVVGLFNLVPGLPLDGGVLLRAAVWKLTGRAYTGTVVAANVGRALAVLLVVAPFLYGPLAGRPLDPFAFVWGLLLASFIWMGAGAALHTARVWERLPSIDARALTRRAIPVAGELPLAEALRQAADAGASALVVVDSMGLPLAVVNEAAVMATPEQRRPWVETNAVARRLEPGMVLQADLGGEALVRAMGSKPATEYLVVEADGAILGVLASADVERAVIAR